MYLSTGTSGEYLYFIGLIKSQIETVGKDRTTVNIAPVNSTRSRANKMEVN
jgi:hypothetical protein